MSESIIHYSDQQSCPWERYSDPKALASVTSMELLQLQRKVLSQMLQADPFFSAIEDIDAVLIDHYMSQIDGLISTQLDDMMHDPEFQALESTWRGLAYCLKNAPFGDGISLELLDVSKQDLSDDFAKHLSTEQTGLYHHLYECEYDLPGGEPFAAIISDFSFSHTSSDVQCLRHIANIAAKTHCPFIANADPQLLGIECATDLYTINDVKQQFDKAEYIEFNGLRKETHSQYLALVFPQFLLRLPHKPQPQAPFQYQESTHTFNEYLWGGGPFAFAANCTKAFADQGWCVQIRGPEAGGRVDGLMFDSVRLGDWVEMKIPTEVMISESKELELSQCGLMPLSYYKKSTHACFFSANSLYQAPTYDDPHLTAHHAINAKLPYLFLTSRIAHYLKVMQRENIGQAKNKQVLSQELNQWLATLVTQMDNPPPAMIAQYPLKQAAVMVEDDPAEPGFFKVTLQVVPHFQIEGVDMQLSLLSQLPKKIEN